MSILSTGFSDGERRTDGTTKPIAVTVPTTCVLSGLGPTKVWGLIKEGRLEVVRIDKRTLVIFASLERLLSPDPDTQPAPRKTPRRKRVKPAKALEV